MLSSVSGIFFFLFCACWPSAGEGRFLLMTAAIASLRACVYPGFSVRFLKKVIDGVFALAGVHAAVSCFYMLL